MGICMNININIYIYIYIYIYKYSSRNLIFHSHIFVTEYYKLCNHGCQYVIE